MGIYAYILVSVFNILARISTKIERFVTYFCWILRVPNEVVNILRSDKANGECQAGAFWQNRENEFFQNR